MRFWDSSAIVPLILDEAESPWARGLMRSDTRGIVWCFSPVEVRSALSRRAREGALTVVAYQSASGRAERLFRGLSQVVALEAVRARALRLLESHSLRAADSLQLSAALVAAKDQPRTLLFVTLDRRLADVAAKEGFAVEIA